MEIDSKYDSTELTLNWHPYHVPTLLHDLLVGRVSTNTVIDIYFGKYTTHLLPIVETK